MELKNVFTVKLHVCSLITCCYTLAKTSLNKNNRYLILGQYRLRKLGIPFFVKNQVFKNKHTVYSTVSGLFESLFYIEQKNTERKICDSVQKLRHVEKMWVHC